MQAVIAAGIVFLYIVSVRTLKHSLVLFCSLVAVFLASSAGADDASKKNYQQVKGKALRAVFSETKMLGEYRDYRDITKTFSYTEFHFKDGTSDYIEGDNRDDGIWKIVGDDKICYNYPKSEHYKRTYCFVVYDLEGCYYKYSTQSMTYYGPRSWDDWTSRAVRKGTGKSCAAPVS